jgi:molecular chaperone DnaK
LGTGKENEITIKDSGGLSQEEIARIKAEAEKFKAEDERKKEEIDKLNAAEGYAYQIRNLLSDESLKDKFTEEQKKGLQEKVDAVIEAVKEKDLQKTEAARTELESMWQPIASEMYKQAAGENGGFDFQDMFDKAQQQGGTPPTDGNDVDFEEVK